MFKAYKYRFYPTQEQELLLAKTFGCVRFVYNKILRWRTDVYYTQKKKIGYPKAGLELTQLKKKEEYSFLNEVSAVTLQQTLRNQQRAFKNFFEGRAKYPTYKKKRSQQSATFMSNAFSYKAGEIQVAKCKEPLNIRWSRELPSTPSSITITKDTANRYFVSCLCDFEPEKLPSTNKKVGIDVGLKHLFVTNTGAKTPNPKVFKKYEERLAILQRRLSKKQRGSANRAKAKLKVARLHAKISDTRKDNLHKLSRRIINENQVICVESLKIKNMVRNPKLAKAISDASWGEFVRQLAYKAEHGKRIFVQIDQFFPSSKRCSSCGYTLDKLSLNTRSWQCPECEITHDRDINAAKNILTAGLAGLVCGESVRQEEPKSSNCRSQRSRKT